MGRPETPCRTHTDVLYEFLNAVKEASLERDHSRGRNFMRNAGRWRGRRREERTEQAWALCAGRTQGAGDSSAHLCEIAESGGAGQEEGLWTLQGFPPPYRALIRAAPFTVYKALEFSHRSSLLVISLLFLEVKTLRRAGEVAACIWRGKCPSVRGQGDLTMGLHVILSQWHLIADGPWGLGQLVAISPS